MIDDEDVSQINAKEIATFMARKIEFERFLTLLAAPKIGRGQSKLWRYDRRVVNGLQLFPWLSLKLLLLLFDSLSLV